MARFSKYLFFLLSVVIVLAGCKSKKTSLSGEDKVDYSDFVDFFPAVTLPYQFEDNSLLKKDNDSLLISHSVFTQFIPDSVLGKVFGKEAKLKIYPMGKAEKEDTYLFAKVVAGNKRAAFVLAFDKKNEFVAGMPLLQPDQSSSTRQSAGMDTRLSLFKSIIRKNADGTSSDGRDVYVLNNAAHAFMLIMTDALDEKVTEIINPIDTLPRKQKNTGDYGSGKMTLVSVRDGRKAGRVSFFIHFEKNNGECTGELKGEAIMKTATQAEYREPGDPCGLQFDFTSSGVKIKELGGCGAHRGLRCSFDGFYPRKKELKPKVVTKIKKPTGK